jgi:hypothetical protein
MQLSTALPSTDIKVITAIVLIVFVALLFGSLYYPLLLLAAAVIGVTIIVCYLYTPVAYDVSGGNLTVVFRKGKKHCGRILQCTQLKGRMPMTLRVWGNSGLFSGTGLFWNRQSGFFRAYVTTSKTTGLVLVEAEIGKVVVSPEHPGEFFQAAGFPLSESP